VEGAAEVTLNGERVDQGGVREVCPQATTNYRLSVRAGEQVLEREVTINVQQGNQPNPQPQPASQQPQPTQKPVQPPAKNPGAAPTPTMVIVQMYLFDLGIDTIYPAASGKIMIRIKNTGDMDAKNNIKLSCQAVATTQSDSQYWPPFQNKTITISLVPGQTADYETGYARDPTMKTLGVSCQITPPANDSNSVNNVMNNVKVK
jgi:hypothetical protein